MGVLAFFKDQRVDEAGTKAVVLEVILLLLIFLRIVHLCLDAFTVQWLSFSISVAMLMLFGAGIYGAYIRSPSIILGYMLVMGVLLCLACLALLLIIIAFATSTPKTDPVLQDSLAVFIFVTIMGVLALILELLSIFYSYKLRQLLLHLDYRIDSGIFTYSHGDPEEIEIDYYDPEALEEKGAEGVELIELNQDPQNRRSYGAVSDYTAGPPAANPTTPQNESSGT